jgi:hypothetical protein
VGPGLCGKGSFSHNVSKDAGLLTVVKNESSGRTSSIIGSCHFILLDNSSCTISQNWTEGSTP